MFQVDYPPVPPTFDHNKSRASIYLALSCRHCGVVVFARPDAVNL
jgi:hypothetical protein